MPKSKTPRQRFLENLKWGDKVWVVPNNLYSNSRNLCRQEVFFEWFDLKGRKGKFCLLAYGKLVPIQWLKTKIFPSRKEALMHALPIVYKKMSEEIDALQKARAKVLDKYDKLLEIEL